MHGTKSYCAACGQTFPSTGHFDAHRKGTYYRNGKDRYCVDSTGKRIVNVKVTSKIEKETN